MKNKEILAKMPVGGIVPKRVLAAMKRKGLIYDYSQWGYLESVLIKYNCGEESWSSYVELFPNGNAKDAESFVVITHNDGSFTGLYGGVYVRFLPFNYLTDKMYYGELK